MENFKKIFKTVKPIIGMIHVMALPGTPKSDNDIKVVVEKAKQEAEIYKKAGIDAVEIENMHDIPYMKGKVGPEIVAAMAVICREVKEILADIPCGIQILAAANKEALAVAKATGLNFIRAEGFVFASVADEGIIESSAGETLRYRKSIGADNVLVFTDIKKKHSSHSITSDIDIKYMAKSAEFFLSDGVIITGAATGEEASTKEIEIVKREIGIPVLVGSGVTLKNLELYFKNVDGLIIGSYFKKGGIWSGELDYKKIKEFMDKANNIRKRIF